MIDCDFSILKGLDYKTNIETGKRCTLKAGGNIKMALFPRTRLDLDVLKELPKDDLVILGNMSNTAVREGGYNGIAIMTDKLTGLEIEDDRIYVGSGEKLPSVVLRLVRLGYIGIERLAGIPASIGGAIAMNAGAFGQEMGDIVEEVIVCDIRQSKIYRLSKSELGFCYRKSNLSRDREMIIGARLHLKQGNDGLTEYDKYRQKRLKLQPQEPSLGSVFIKTDGISAGYYIDQCGYKGYLDNGIMVSNKHANFIVNTGGGTVAAYERVKNFVKSAVKHRLGISLKEEVRIIGQDEDSRNSQKGYLRESQDS